MPKVKVLVEGYVRDNGSRVVPTTTLIIDGETNIIVDPGMGPNKRNILEEALVNEGLTFKDIDVVFCTHYHLDHTRNAGFFDRARVIDYKYIYQDDQWLDHDGDGYHISPQVTIKHTPGHTPEHSSLIVESHEGKIVVAGDLWWLSDMTPVLDYMAINQEQLESSRQEILKSADFIIPGHGKMFKVER